ncbi:MAG: 4'-phosphopantetheinyl transferase superfamily protein [Nitrospinae bacterium]|nr:4'-phosphopantetheinyl transferase superfamily protein [Nitrospinota bacterium]
MSADALDSWFRTYREIDDILITHVDLSPDEECEAHAISWLDEKERDRLRRYRYDRPRREFALCRAVLRSILCSRLGCENGRLSFGTFEHGKPFGLVDGKAAPVSFNVSHSGKHGLIALAPKGRLGVDVEERVNRIDLDGVGEFVFGPEEQADFASVKKYEKRHLFFKLWTLKEALIKALGTGFSLDPSRFEIPPEMRRGARKGIFRFPHIPEARWRLENLGNADFAAAIAQELDPALDTKGE